jgi:sulfate transporter 4
MMTDSLAELPPPKSCTSFVTDEDLQPQEERADTSLLLRHRAPSATAASHHHRLESDRIRTDTEAHVRHAVPVDDQNGDDDDDDEPGSCWWLWLQRRRQLVTKQACKEYWKQIMPCQQCLKYSLTMFRKDVVAGVTVAVMAIPLSMSYARLAGLPAYYGLYATLLPPVMYPVFASSRQLAVGTAALISLLVSSSLPPILQDEGLTDATSPEYIARYAQLAYQCAFLVGLINITMGLLRLGFITQFLSRALVSGFCSGAAVIIAVSQIKYIFGYNVPSSSRLQTLIKGLIDGISQFNWKTFLMGSLSVIILVSIKVASQKHPKLSWIRPVGPFLVSILAIILVVTLDLDTRGIPVVGNIPKGLPDITITLWTPLSNRLWVPVISMVIVGFVQSISIAKRLAYKHGDEIDSSQELIALGMANLVGGAFQSYPVTGALGQSAANDDTGAQTGLASVVTAAVVLIVLLFLTPVFENIPMAVLAATVISFVLGMFVSRNAVHTYTHVVVTVWYYYYTAILVCSLQKLSHSCRTIKKPFTSTKCTSLTFWFG